MVPTMKLTTSCLGVGVILVMLSSYPTSSAQRGPASDAITRAAAEVAAAEQQLAGVKTDVLATFKSLQDGETYAEAQSDKWAQLGQHEADASMQAIDYAFRDAFRSHAEQLTRAIELLRDLGKLGERLESDVTVLKIAGTALEQAVRGQVAAARVPSLVADAKSGLDLVQRDISVSLKILQDEQKLLRAHMSAVLEYGKGVRQLLQAVGDPQDRIGQWQKQVVQTELDNNTREAKELTGATAIGMRLAGTLTTMANSIKDLQLAALGL
jgi:hypothetical protein